MPLSLLTIPLPLPATETFMDGLEEFADSLSCFEDGSSEDWLLLAYFQEAPDMGALAEKIAVLARAAKIPEPEYKLSDVPDEDWVAESQKNFKPIKIGRFFVHASWRRDEIPAGLEPIEIDPQRAFGTGGHETTRGCLLAMQRLAENHEFKNTLDMGCGSGLLAIGMKRIWKNAAVLAVDNDTVCVTTSAENAIINKVDITVALSDGYKSEIVQARAPYDLIAANILAAPLIAFAPEAAKALVKGGFIILSGLLATQSAGVIAAHESTGLKLIESETDGQWGVVVMRKE